MGVFTVMIGPESPTLYVLIVHRTLDAFAALEGRLAADAEFQKAGAPYLEAVAADPAFVRLESSLMRAFDGMPRLELPFGGGEAGKRPRIFELRVYESHSEAAGRKKIGMFNNGEIAIFRKAGLQPVFFGETIVGANMPNLTYLLVYEDMAARDRQWAAFAADPAWRTLSTTPGLTDPEIVLSISNAYLRPTAFSEKSDDVRAALRRECVGMRTRTACRSGLSGEVERAMAVAPGHTIWLGRGHCGPRHAAGEAEGVADLAVRAGPLCDGQRRIVAFHG